MLAISIKFWGMLLKKTFRLLWCKLPYFPLITFLILSEGTLDRILWPKLLFMRMTYGIAGCWQMVISHGPVRHSQSCMDGILFVRRLWYGSSLLFSKDFALMNAFAWYLNVNVAMCKIQVAHQRPICRFPVSKNRTFHLSGGLIFHRWLKEKGLLSPFTMHVVHWSIYPACSTLLCACLDFAEFIVLNSW